MTLSDLHLSGVYTMVDYQYKDLFLQSHVDKQLKIATDDGLFTATNKDIHFEDFELTESICSDSELRFGSCEAGMVKFQIRNAFIPLVGKWMTVTETLNGNTNVPFQYGRYKVFSDKPTADKEYRDIVAYDSMYDILNADMAGWYNKVLPKEASTMTMRQLRTSFINHFGLETVLPEGGLINDSMTVERTIDPERISGKDIITAICEINGCFGHIGRDGKFHYIYLTQAIEGLYPSNTLYPDHAPEWMVQSKTGHLYPQDPKSTRIESGRYIKCQYEDYRTKWITKLQIREKENDIGKTWPEGDVLETDNCYIIQDNFLVYGKSSDELAVIAQNIFGKITDIVYRPFGCTAVGNPCLEVGDPVRLLTKYEIVESYILKRTMKGIQAPRDKYVADGTEKYTEKLNGVQRSILQLKGKTNVLTRTIEETRLEMSDMEKELNNTITATAEKLTANLQNTKAGLEATISATAGSLETEIANTRDGLQTSISQTADKIAAEVSRATAAESSLSSQISLLAGQIVLKADANGRMVQVALSADAASGSEFKVDADNINLTANDVMNLMAGGTLNLSAMNINITSNNWSVDSNGDMVCNKLAAVQFVGQAVDDLNDAIFNSETMRKMQEIVDLYNQKFIAIEELLTNDKVVFDMLDQQSYYWHHYPIVPSGLWTPYGGLQSYVNVDTTGYKYLIVRCRGRIDSTPSGQVDNHQYIVLTFSYDPANNNPDTPVVNIVHKFSGPNVGEGQIGEGPNGEGYTTWYNAYINISALTGSHELHCFGTGGAEGYLWCSKMTLTNQEPG